MFYDEQIKHFNDRHKHLIEPPSLELIHVGSQKDSKYAIFIEHRYYGSEIVFSYPSMLEPMGIKYWYKKMTKSGWPAEIRAFPKSKIKQFSKRLNINCKYEV